MNMRKPKSNNIEVENVNIQSRSPIYQLLSHEKYEIKNLPLNFNLLTFLESAKTQKLTTALYEDPESKNLSEEFKSNLIYYFSFNFTYFLILLSFSILSYSSSSLPSSHLSIHLTCTIFFLILFLSLQILLYTSKHLKNHIREVFFFLSICTSFYFILADERILCKLTGDTLSETRLPLTFGLITSTVIARFVLFDHFLYILILGIFNSLLFLTTQLAVTKDESYTTLSESAFLTLFSVVQILDCYRSDLRIKQIFWRREKEAMSEMSIDKRCESFRTSGINTDAESVLSACSLISSNLKKVSRVVIFKDVKKLLKESLLELDKIKYRLAHGNFEFGKIELRAEMDEDDRTFIRQSFMHVSSIREMYKMNTSLISERPSLIPFNSYGVTELESVLSSIGKNWSFDIFFLYETTGQSISIVSKYLLQKWNLIKQLQLEEASTDKYFVDLENAYYQNPYHNARHASDVLHSLLYFITNSEIFKSLTSIDLFGVIVAALGHDVGHPGLTNRFLVNNYDSLALQYNDLSVLENMHCSLTFTLGYRQDCDVFGKLDPDYWRCLRKMVIEMILETDMCKHFEVLAKFKTRAILLSDFNIAVVEDKCSVLSMGLKCADIAHSAKDTNLHVRWSNLVSEEFFSQGDIEKERNLPVSMYCDRENADTPKIQAGFLRNICLPLFEVWCSYLNSEFLSSSVLDQLKNNLAYWESRKKRQATEVLVVDTKSPVTDMKRRQSHF